MEWPRDARYARDKSVSRWGRIRAGSSASTRCFAGSEGERSGGCHFAGEHCSTDFQGFMEGAAQEGARAAGEIVSDYRR